MDKMYKRTPGQGGHISEQLSAYIDGALGAAEHEAARLHLDACPLCRAECDELLVTRDLLRSVPMMAPPRAFTLTGEMVGRQRRDGFWERLLAPRNAPRLATGSVLSFALVVMLLVGNLLASGGLNLARQAAPAPMAQMGAAAPTATSLSESYDRLETELSTQATPGLRAGGELATNEAQPRELMPTAEAQLPHTAATAMPDATPVIGSVPEPTATMASVADAGITSGITSEPDEKSALIPPNTGDAGEPAAKLAPTEVTLSLAAEATARALSLYRDYNYSLQATAEAEAVGRVPSGAAYPRAESDQGLFDEPSGDGRGFYVGLLLFFLGLGMVLGAGALIARRRT